MRSALLGRETEVALFAELCSSISHRGTALLVEGDPGVGKTALVAEYEVLARARDMAVLRATGSPAEIAIPYAGLHLLAAPLASTISELAMPQRSALEVVFGMAAGPTPAPFLAGLALLSLFARATEVHPMLVIVEDIQWFDAASRSALMVAARRVGTTPLLVVATCRSGYDVGDVSGITRQRLEPLSFIDANALLDTRPDRPQGSARRALLELASGNPLALVELSPTQPAPGSYGVAVTDRLEVAFAGRYRALGEPVQMLVLALALVGQGNTDDALAAVTYVIGDHHQDHAQWVGQAIAAGLLSDTMPQIAFRHPLVRSAVISASDVRARSTMIAALLRVVNDPQRTVWWRAETTVGRDPQLADELDHLATAALTTGDHGHAIAGLTRAAELTRDPQVRGERLIRAAQVAIRSGEYPTASELLDAVTSAADISWHRAQWLRQLVPSDPPTELAQGDLGPSLAAIEAMTRADDPDAALEALLHLASVAWNHSTRADRGSVFTAAVQRLRLDRDDPRMLFLAALTDPAANADEVIARISGRPRGNETPETTWYLGYALNLCGEIDCAAEYLDKAAYLLRDAGNVVLLPHALMARAWICYLQGEVTAARTHIGECVVLARDTADPQLGAAAAAAVSLFDALDAVVPHVDESDTAARDLLATRTLAEVMAHLTAERPGDAVRGALLLADPGSPAYTPMFAIISLPDLVEATMLTGQPEVARRHIAAIEHATLTWHAPAVAAALRLASVLELGGTDDPDAASEGLLSDPLPMPLFDARAHLHLGTLFRRRHQNARARKHLQMARSVFAALPAPAWEARATAELRSSGERDGGGAAGLTPQELRISQLAASGLSNREIAEQLFLSPRTVGAHLYAAFRKLGIHHRQELAGTPLFNGVPPGP